MTTEVVAPSEAPPKRSILRGNVLAFSLVSMFQDIASEMIRPILPLFMVTVLFAPPTIMGLIEGQAESLGAFLKVLSGWMSDRSGRRKLWASGGYTLSGLVKPFYALTTAWPQVLIIRTLDLFGKGVRGAPRDALMAMDVPAEKRGQAFGFHRSMDSLGAVIGPILAAILLAAYQNDQSGIRAVFAWAIIPGLLSAAFSVLLVRERAQPSKREASAPLPRLTLAPFDRRFKRFLLVIGLFTLGNSSDQFLLLRARFLGPNAEIQGVPLVLIPLVWLVFNVVFTLGAGPAGWLSDRVPRKHVLAAGFVVYALVYVGFALVGETWQVWLLFAFYGLYYAMTEGVGRAFIADLAPTELRGTAFGLYFAATGLALLPASIIAGILWDTVGPWAPFAFGAGWSALAALLLWLWM
jgi:MFS family permease